MVAILALIARSSFNVGADMVNESRGDHEAVFFAITAETMARADWRRVLLRHEVRRFLRFGCDGGAANVAA